LNSSSIFKAFEPSPDIKIAILLIACRCKDKLMSCYFTLYQEGSVDK
jgi:hypothetical protein